MRFKVDPNHGLLKHLKVKVFAFFCAIVLWFFVAVDNQYEHAFHIPVKPVNLPPEWIFLEPPPKKVKVLLRGKGQAFLNALFSDRYLELNLDGNPEKRTIRLDVSMIKRISDKSQYKAVRILEPEVVDIKLDRFTEKLVPVVPSRLEFKLRDGYTRVGDIRFHPDSVRINGPVSLIDSIDYVQTRPLKRQNLDRDAHGYVALEEPRMHGITQTPKQVAYDVDIQRRHEQILREVPVRITHVPPGLKVKAVPSTLSIHLQGGVDVIKNIKKEDIRVTIDYRTRYRYKGRGIPAKIEVPKEVTFSYVNPQSFDLLKIEE